MSRQLLLLTLLAATPAWADEPAVRIFEGHRDYVRDVAFMPDGKSLASASRDGSVRLWDVATGKELRRLAEGQREFWSVACSPQGKYVAASGYSGTLMWETETGKFVRRFGDASGELRCLAFTPDGGTLLAQQTPQPRTHARGVAFYDVATGKELRTIETNAFCFALSADGKRLVTGEDRFLENDRPVALLHLWNCQTGAWIRTFDAPKSPAGSKASCAYSHVAFSPDGQIVVSSNTFDGNARLWDAATGKEIATYNPVANPCCALFTRNAGHLLISSSSDSFWIQWDPETRQETKRFVGQKSRADRLALSPDGKYAASASPDHSLGLWKVTQPDADSGKIELDRPVEKILFLKSGRLIVQEQRAGSVSCWNVATDPISREWRKDLSKGFVLRELKNGDLLTVENSPHLTTFRGVNVRTGETTFETRLGKEFAKEVGNEFWRFLDVSPSGELACLAAEDVFSDPRKRIESVVVVVETRSGKTRKILKGHQHPAYRAAFSHREDKLLTLGRGGEIFHWHLDQQKHDRPDFNFRRGWAVGFSPDDKMIVLANSSLTIRLLSAADFTTISEFQVQDGGVTKEAWAFLNKSSLFLVGSHDVQCFKANGGESVKAKGWTRGPEMGEVYQLAISPDESFAAVLGRHAKIVEIRPLAQK